LKIISWLEIADGFQTFGFVDPQKIEAEVNEIRELLDETSLVSVPLSEVSRQNAVQNGWASGRTHVKE